MGFQAKPWEREDRLPGAPLAAGLGERRGPGVVVEQVNNDGVPPGQPWGSLGAAAPAQLSP